MTNRTGKRYRYRHKIYLSMILASVLPVIILGLYSYHTYITEFSQRKNLTMQVTANQVKSRVENILDSIKQYYCEVENKEEIKTLISADDLYYNQYSRLKEGIDVLTGPVYLRDYVQAYTFINVAEDWVVSTYGMYRYSEIADTPEMKEVQERLEGSRDQCCWLNRMGQERPAVLPAGRSIVLSDYVMVLRLPMLSVEDKCLLLINLNDVKLRNLMAENLDDMDVTIVNTRGELVYTSSALMGEYCISHMEEVERAGDYMSVKLPDGSRHRMAATTATRNGLIYVASYNMAAVTDGAEQILSFAVVLLVVLGLVLIGVCAGTKIIYTPVSKLTTQMNDVLETPQSGIDEITLLEKGFNQLVKNRESLERMIENQKEMLVELFLTRLLRGELTQERIDEGVERFDLKKKACYIGLSMGLAQGEHRMNSMEQDALMMTVVDNLPQEMKKMFFAAPVIRNNVIFFILGSDTEEELEQKSEEIFEQISQYIYNSYGCHVYGGVSRTFHKLKHLRTAHNEGVEALKNSESFKVFETSDTDTEKAICFYSDFSKNKENSYRYDLFAEQEIRRAVDACEKDAAFAAVDKFIDRLLEKGVSRQERYFFLHRFLIAILQVASEAGLSMNQIFEGEEDNLFLALDSIVEPENIRQFYKSQIIEPVVSNLAQYRRSHSVDIMEQVIALVKEKNGDITLTECAEQLNYHPSYIWRVLKTENNMTFTDFVALEKIELAKEMLLETTLSVAEIAQKLNYTNTQNFIRFFSKHEGITPGKYRQEHKEKE